MLQQDGGARGWEMLHRLVRGPQRGEKGARGFTKAEQRASDRTGCLLCRLRRVSSSLPLVTFNPGPGFLCTTAMRQAAFYSTLTECRNSLWEKLNLCVRVCVCGCSSD